MLKKALHGIGAHTRLPVSFGVKVRHEVAQIECSQVISGEPGMFLPDPTQACYRRGDDGVRSPADNVPKRV